MYRRFLAPLLLIVSSALAQPASTAIFDGRSLEGWEGASGHWRVEGGAITAEIAAGQTLAKNEFLFWKGEAHDFELTLEFRIEGAPSANSGIQFRSERLAGGEAKGYQADLDDGAVWLGRIYEEGGRALLAERGVRASIAPDGRRWSDPIAAPADFIPRVKRGDWNAYRIVATGPHVELWINGSLWTVLDDHQVGAAKYSGRIGLQLHAGAGPAKVQFRHLQLTPHGRTAFPATPAFAEDKPTRATQSPVLWHLRPNPAAPTAVPNAEAQKVVGTMLLTDGFQAEVIAAEPEVHQPVAFAIDERGRLWVAEAHSYPSKQPAGKGKDRILILEDRDGDGVFETKTVFIEGLNLVSALEVGFGGVWVGAAPEVLFIPDRNHDDRPDGAPEVLLDGWGYQDTHETLNSFSWGPDGWLYGNQGVFTKSLVGKPGTPAAERTPVRAAVWRYHPVRHEFEVFATGGSNQWGIDFNSVGHLFMTHCRSFYGGGGTSYVIRNGHYWNQVNTGYAPFISNAAPDFAPELKNFLPASARYDSGEGGAGKPGTTAIYGGHSHVGTMIYLGDNWPDAYRDHLFTHNLHGHQMNQQENVRQGSGYETFHAGADLLYAPDPSYIAVDLQTGPDGAVYVIDWVDRQHCHTPMDERWDRTNGRIYRVSWAATYRPRAVNLGAESDAALVALHVHRNEWFVRTARRLLQDRAATGKLDRAALAPLRAQAVSADAVLALRALWTLHVTGGLDQAGLDAALAHGADVVRAWAVQLATEQARAIRISAAQLEQLARSDPSPVVRLAVASALPLVAPEARWSIGTALAAHAEDADDRFLPRVTWSGLADVVDQDVPRALALAARTPIPGVADSIRWYLARTAPGRQALVGELAAATEGDAARELRLLAFSLRGEATLPMPAEWPKVAARFGAGAADDLHEIAEQLSAVFGDQAVLARMRTLLADTGQPFAVRRKAFAVLKRVGDRAALPIYVRLVEEEPFRSRVLPLLGGSDEPGVPAVLLRLYPTLDANDRSVALNVLTSRPAFAAALLEAVQGGAFEKKNLTALHSRQMRSLGDARVNALLDRVWGRVGESSAETKATIARLKKSYEAAPLWAYDTKAGKLVFQRTCAACHAINGEGGQLGPDLAGSWRNGLDYFLENIVDPNAVVGADFQLNVITRKDGAVISGLIDRTTETALVVRTTTGTVTVPRADIKTRETMAQSLMPPGLLESLPNREVIELLKYLTAKN